MTINFNHVVLVYTRAVPYGRTCFKNDGTTLPGCAKGLHPSSASPFYLGLHTTDLYELNEGIQSASCLLGIKYLGRIRLNGGLIRRGRQRSLISVLVARNHTLVR